MPVAQQTSYIDGLFDGMGVAFTVTETMAPQLAGKAGTAAEKQAIEAMRLMPQRYLGQARFPNSEAARMVLIGKCQAEPARLTASVFIGVVSTPN